MEQLSRASLVSSRAESLLQRAAEVRKCDTWANEDIILATADYLKQDIHVITVCRTTALWFNASQFHQIKILFL